MVTVLPERAVEASCCRLPCSLEMKVLLALQMGDKCVRESSPDGRKGEEERTVLSPGTSPFSSKLGAMMRIRNKYLALKRRRVEQGGPQSAVAGRLSLRSTSPEIFTFDLAAGPGSGPGVEPHAGHTLRRKRRRKSRVLFPSGGRRFLPATERSRAKPFLFLLSVVLFLQVYNAIENLDDHLLRYDLEGLEKTLRREVFGQREAAAVLLQHLRDYLSTYAHNKPLALSLHGPTGVGKSLLGRVLARHFRSVVGERLVVQYFTTHHCPPVADAGDCARDLLARVATVVGWAEEEEKIPLLVFDEVESMPGRLLDALHGLLRPEQANEYLNAVYLVISSLGGAQITSHVLQNSSSSAGQSLALDLGPRLRHALQKLHPLWAEVDLVPLTLLQKQHVMECFLDEMTQEGFYPDRTHIERLAEELAYHSVGGLQYSRTGCKQVVAKVNLL
ncbi:torsin family 4, member Ab isoform X2 [Anguilla anguilla]|uniref:torsin family 4, member Ab isoform X2 n=1 Tax=Anguilla anguilla TaxID=7936 RepID=UPI0015AA35F1|nr:torsin family 4, member Ab isoform X2 [Anguilla anguilla]